MKGQKELAKQRAERAPDREDPCKRPEAERARWFEKKKGQGVRSTLEDSIVILCM